MRACVFRRPRKSLTSPDAEKTSVATQRPAEELRNWQSPHGSDANNNLYGGNFFFVLDEIKYDGSVGGFR